MVVSGRLWAGTILSAGLCYNANKAILGPYNKHPDTYLHSGPVAFKQYRGMSSAESRAGIMKPASVEGVSGLIPYTGTTEDFITNFTQNMQSALSYGGALNWDEFRRNVEAIHITQAAWAESLTHVE